MASLSGVYAPAHRSTRMVRDRRTAISGIVRTAISDIGRTAMSDIRRTTISAMRYLTTDTGALHSRQLYNRSWGTATAVGVPQPQLKYPNCS